MHYMVAYSFVAGLSELDVRSEVSHIQTLKELADYSSTPAPLQAASRAGMLSALGLRPRVPMACFPPVTLLILRDELCREKLYKSAC